jgi:peptidoglycan/LPS O-acetylase OafA/YrhL
MSSSKIYFKNLDGLRFIAAFIVLLEHCTLFKSARNIGLSNYFQHNFHEIGGKGVSLFFVLSGFLITYLLLAEDRKTGTISIKKFYIRRVLRIWPLYFLVGCVGIFLGNFVLAKLGLSGGNDPLFVNFLFLSTFTVNLQLIFFAYNRAIVEGLWSVCIEEQFYFIWPWLVKYGRASLLWILIAAVVIGIGSNYLFYYFSSNWVKGVYYFTTCRFDLFGIGGLAAYAKFNPKVYATIRYWIESVWMQILVLTVAVLFVFNIIGLPGYINDHFQNCFYGIIFSTLILSLVSERSIINLQNKLMVKLGTYSYGIYVYHSWVAQILLIVFLKYIPNSFFSYDILYPLVAIILTSVLSFLSYVLFENRFLQLKEKFAVVKSKPVLNAA